jgi:hypothetical protein
MLHRQSLLDGFFGAADEILILTLDPKVRWIIRDVGENGDQRYAGQGAPEAFAERSVKIRHQRDHQVRPALTPQLLQHPHLLAVKQANHQVHAGSELRRTEGPAFLEHQIVKVLHAQAGELAENVDRIQEFLQIDQPDIEEAALSFDDALQRIGGRAMAAAGVEEDEIEPFQYFDCGMRRKLWYLKHTASPMFFPIVTEL